MRPSELYERFFRTLKIRNKAEKIVPLVLNNAQQMVWRQMTPKLDAGQRVWVILLKARQEGMSTLTEALMTTHAALRENVNALIMAHEAKATRRIWNMTKLMIDHHPFLKTQYRKVDNELHLGSSMIDVATAGTKATARSATLSAVHASENSQWPSPETLLALLQCLPDHEQTLCILESTANGMVGVGRQFYEEWHRAVAGESDFTPIFIPWYAMAEYAMPNMTITDLTAEEEDYRDRLHLTLQQLAWRRMTIASKCQGNLMKFRQEYPATAEEAFIVSGLPFFSNEQLSQLQDTLRAGRKASVEANGALTPDSLGYVEIFRDPEPGRQYVVGADPSIGIDDASHSRSAAQVLDMETLEQVAEYESSVPLHVFARHLVGLARAYNSALLAPEVQSSGGGGGGELLVYIQQLDYWQLHMKRHVDHVRKSVGQLYGWETNMRTRQRMIARIQEAIYERSAEIHSRKLYEQLRIFGKTDEGRVQAIGGHDDLLFAWGIAMMSRSENYTAALYGSTSPEQELALAGVHRVKTMEQAEAEHWNQVLRPGVNAPNHYLVM